MNPLSWFGSLLGSLISWFPKLQNFNYNPFTSWNGAMSPSVYVGCNLQQARVERDVVTRVGSYGTQLNRVLDALAVVVKQIDRTKLSEKDQMHLVLLEKLAKDADEAATLAKRSSVPISVRIVDQLLGEPPDGR